MVIKALKIVRSVGDFALYVKNELNSLSQQ